MAGAILVFSTLNLQRKALNEEIRKNKFTRFDSRFYSILSIFRNDAINMEIVLDCIREKGRGYGQPTNTSYFGDKAFFICRKLIETLYDQIIKDTFCAYNAEDLSIEIGEIDKKEMYLIDNGYPDDDLDKVIAERAQFIHSRQGGYLLYKYGITKNRWQQCKEMEKHALFSFLLEKLIARQPTILLKYIQGLRFILHVIEELPNEMDRKDYYLNISFQLGKEEFSFLKCFNEFNIITCI